MNHATATPLFDASDIVHRYTRSQALADGTLVDVSTVAAEAGFRVPAAVTRAVWFDCIEWTDTDTEKQTHQDQSGRLWDVLWMCSVYARRYRNADLPTPAFLFPVFRVKRDGRALKPTKALLKAILGPGDEGEPVLTIMDPDED